MANHLQMEKTPINGQGFFLDKHHPKNHKKIQLVYKVDKQDIEKSDKLDFLPSYQGVKVGEQLIYESKAPEWMDTKIKI